MYVIFYLNPYKSILVIVITPVKWPGKPVWWSYPLCLVCERSILTYFVNNMRWEAAVRVYISYYHS